jgi:hypothetical protein
MASLSFASSHASLFCCQQSSSAIILRPAGALLRLSRRQPSSHTISTTDQLFPRRSRMPRNVDTHAAAERNSPSTMSSLEAVDELQNGDSAVVVREQQQPLMMGATDDGLPPSPYDTAWVAMVPAPGNPLVPRFPRCVDWILQNQRSDGSWGPDGGSGDHPSSPLGKDALMSTLACVLALKTWDAGEEHVRKGSSSSYIFGAASLFDGTHVLVLSSHANARCHTYGRALFRREQLAVVRDDG